MMFERPRYKNGFYFNNGNLGHSYNQNKKRKRLKSAAILAGITLALGLSADLLTSKLSANGGIFDRLLGSSLTKQEIAQLLGRRFTSGTPPVESEQIGTPEGDMTVHYTLDSRLQEAVEKTIKRGKVDYGAFVAIDVNTGQILAMVSHGMQNENLALRATFPAASIFKIVTAAAAIESGKVQRKSKIPFSGRNHTLYKRNVLVGGLEPGDYHPRFTRFVSFDDAFARSINSVFGKVGIFGVGSEGLRAAASDFQFGKAIPFEMPVDISQATIPDDEFGLAESASGFTRRNTLSPLHGALIAAAVANEGVMMEPSVVSRIIDGDGNLMYESQPKPMATVIDKTTSAELEQMMRRTIVNGTSRRAFRNKRRNWVLADAFIGGKTGSLNGWNPAGRYDWFVGFGEQANVKIAVAALCIHGKYYGIKASQVARSAFEAYFQPLVAELRSRDKSAHRAVN